MSKPPTDWEVFTLHRYFVWANRMRTEFDAVLQKRDSMDAVRFEIEGHLYLSLWYGCLYVVIEGWNQLGLEDETIGILLESPNIPLLRRYRNAVFHYQRNYSDTRWLELIQEGEKVATWIRALNQEFGRFFLQWFSEQREKRRSRTNPTAEA